MRPAVFVGPSLDLEDIAGFDVEVLPPAGRGDLDALLARNDPPAAVGIVDGCFLQRPSISPKEVLRAIDRGTQVYGSSSMGALRAVECERYGMIGVGRIFEAYRSGRFDADDEVAMTYDPRSLRALSEPLINMRFAMESAVEAGVVSSALATRFVEIAQTIYFPSRTTSSVLARLRREGDEVACDRLAAFLKHGARNAKREDAHALLSALINEQP
jgi:hypothetical protein